MKARSNAPGRRIDPDTERLADEVISEWERDTPRRNVRWIVAECARRAAARNVPTLGYVSVVRRLKERNLDWRTHRASEDAVESSRDASGAMRPMERVVIDHVLLDIDVMRPSGGRIAGRSSLAVAFDVCSGMVVGFALNHMGSYTLAVALTIGMAGVAKTPWLRARKLDIEWPVSGIPRTLASRNGSDFSPTFFRQACERYNIRLEHFSKDDSVVGSDIRRHLGDLRSQANGLSGATEFEIERWFAGEIMDRYHHQVDVAKGVTPLALWKRGVRRHPVVSASDTQRFPIDFLAEDRRRVHPDGVRMHQLRYWSPEFPRLFPPRQGRSLVKYDPRDLSRIFALVPDGSRYVEAGCASDGPPVSLAEVELAPEHLTKAGVPTADEDQIFAAIEKQRRGAHAAADKSSPGVGRPVNQSATGKKPRKPRGRLRAVTDRLINEAIDECLVGDTEISMSRVEEECRRKAEARGLWVPRPELIRSKMAKRGITIAMPRPGNAPLPRRLTAYRASPPPPTQLSPEREQLLEKLIDAWSGISPLPPMTWIRDHWTGTRQAAGDRSPGRRTIIARLKKRQLYESRATVSAPKSTRAKEKARAQTHDDSTGELRPLEQVQLDHVFLGIDVSNAPGIRGFGLPWVSAVFDVATELVLGFTLNLKRPDSVAAGLTLVAACLPKEAWLKERRIDIRWPAAGIPGSVRLRPADDRNGIVRRACGRYGINLDEQTSPIGAHIKRHLGNIAGRAKALSGASAAELERWFAMQVVAPYHRTRANEARFTPEERWDAQTKRHPVTPVPDPVRFAIDFLPELVRDVKNGGVDFHGVRYQSSELLHLFGPGRGAGSRALVKYDPRDLSRVFVSIADVYDGYLAAPYGNPSRPPINLMELYLARAALRVSRSWHPSEDQIFAMIEVHRHRATSLHR
jgi:putative transposase